MDIVFKNVHKNFGELKVLQDFSALFVAGKSYFLAGDSGVGKTTLANILVGLLQPDEGEIIGRGQNRFSCVFQEDRLVEKLSGLQNIQLVLDSAVNDDTLSGIFMSLNLLEGDITKPVFKLSGGQRRRVALVRAMEAESDFIVLDEPFKGLESDMVLNCSEYVQSRRKNRSVLLISHNPDDGAWCDERLRLNTVM